MVVVVAEVAAVVVVVVAITNLQAGYLTQCISVIEVEKPDVTVLGNSVSDEDTLPGL